MQKPGGSVPVNTRSFQNDMRNFKGKDDVLTLLIHIGYLAYDSVKREAFIPNKEIIEEFETAMNAGGWSEVARVLKASENGINYDKDSKDKPHQCVIEQLCKQ